MAGGSNAGVAIPHAVFGRVLFLSVSRDLNAASSLYDCVSVHVPLVVCDCVSVCIHVSPNACPCVACVLTCRVRRPNKQTVWEKEEHRHLNMNRYGWTCARDDKNKTLIAVLNTNFQCVNDGARQVSVRREPGSPSSVTFWILGMRSQDPSVWLRDNTTEDASLLCACEMCVIFF